MMISVLCWLLLLNKALLLAAQLEQPLDEGVDQIIAAVDFGYCSIFYNIENPISLASCNDDFEECFISGYSDDYLCEGCSLVSNDQISYVTETDVDCSCTCCLFQFLQNHCFKHLCSDTDEYNRLVNYTSSICQNSNKRTTLKPYIPDKKVQNDDSILSVENIELFSSANNTLYRSLIEDEKDFLFKKLGDVFDVASFKHKVLNEFGAEGLADQDQTYDEEDIFRSFEKEENNLDEYWNYIDAGAEAYIEVDEDELLYQIFSTVSNTDDGVERFEKRNNNNEFSDFSKLAVNGNIQAFVESKDEITFGAIQNIFESYIDQPNEFFTIAKVLLGASRYDTFYGAFQESEDIIRVDSNDFVSNAYCLESDSKSLGVKVMDVNLEVIGCYLSTIIKSSEKGLCPTSEHCSCKCATVIGLKKCVESYSKDSEELIALTIEDIDTLCVPINNDAIDPLNYDESHYEDKLQEDFSFLKNLQIVAQNLDFDSDLAEFQSELLWRSSTSSNIYSPEDVSAAIIIDKCELRPGDLNDYFQFNMDSCDIRDLYYCKNHYKGRECSLFAKDANACNSACCLQIKMAKCASTHCKSKKALMKFEEIANHICTEYADPHVTNGSSFPEDEDGYDDDVKPCSTVKEIEPINSVYSINSEEKIPCEYEERPPADRTDLSPGKRDFLESYFESPIETGAVTEENYGFLNDTDVNFEDFTVQVKYGDTEDDVKARIRESVCEIPEFYPPYDTTGCDKIEVKDCIKEGIQALKEDPKHFCPYCVNDNSYDECRCACCFGKYFSNVCYDPNCKGLKEKLRYKRYIKEVCKTKPIKKPLKKPIKYFARDEEYDASYSDVQGKARFKAKIESVPSLESDSLNVINLFDHPDSTILDSSNSTSESPFNLKQSLLNSMGKSSLRKAQHLKRELNENQDIFEEYVDGESLVKRSESLGKGIAKYHKAKSFAKTGSVEKKKKRPVSRFSPSDRKVNVMPDMDVHELRREKIKKKKRVTGPHRTAKKKRPSRRNKSKQKISVAPNNEQRLETEQKIEERRNQILQIYKDPAKSIPSKVGNIKVSKREVLYHPSSSALFKVKTVSPKNTSTKRSSKRYRTVTKTMTKIKTPLFNSTFENYSTTYNNSFKIDKIFPKPIEVTLTTTIHKTDFNTIRISGIISTTTVLSTSTPTKTITDYVTATPPIVTTSTTIKTRFRPTTETETDYEETSTLTTTFFSDTLTVYFPKTTLYRYKDTSIGTETSTVTDTTIKTKTKLVPLTTITEYEESDKTITISLPVPTTTTETWIEDISTATVTTYSDTMTTTGYKYTKTKFKNTGTVTETATSTVTERSIRTKWYPEFTVTEFDELVTTTKVKWFPYTTTELSTTTTTMTSTVIQIQLQGRATPTAGSNRLAQLLPRDLANEEFENFRSLDDSILHETRPQTETIEELEIREDIIEDITNFNESTRINNSINNTANISRGTKVAINPIMFYSFFVGFILILLSFSNNQNDRRDD